jgi:hypothetical protein
MTPAGEELRLSSSISLETSTYIISFHAGVIFPGTLAFTR